MIVEQLRRDVELTQLAAVMAAAVGGQLDAISFSEAQRRLDEYLNSPVSPATGGEDPDAQLREALGLGAGG